MSWIQASVVMQGNIEVIGGEEQPLMMVTPDLPVVVGDLDGKMLMTIFSRPWFVPLTQPEASAVRAALQTGDASVLRLFLEDGPLVSMITESTNSKSESAS